MRSIWKFPLPIGPSVVEMPNGAEVLTVQTQNDQPCLWALVDTDHDIIRRVFDVFGTGHIMPRSGKYIGTFQLDGGAFMGHVFEQLL